MSTDARVKTRRPGGLDRHRHSYEPRYASPPPVSRTEYAPYPKAKSRSRWPPPPSVEDEAESLSREFGSTPSLGDGTGGEACMRGAVDQEPIMIDVEPLRPRDKTEQRFVLLSQDSSHPDPPRGRADNREKLRAPPLNTKLEHSAPEFARRQPSPYAYKPPQPSPHARSNRHSASGAGDYFLSPDPITPSSATSRATPSTPRREKAAFSDSSNNTSRASASSISTQDFAPDASSNRRRVLDSDSDVDRKEDARRARKRSGRYSFTQADLPRKQDEADDRSFTVKKSATTPLHSLKQSNHSSASTTDLPSLRDERRAETFPDTRDRPRRSPPRESSASKPAPIYGRSPTGDVLYDGCGSSKVSSRTDSPPRRHHERRVSGRRDYATYPPSPPRSDRPYSTSDDEGPSLPSRSRPGTRPNSRPPSPVQSGSGYTSVPSSPGPRTVKFADDAYPPASKKESSTRLPALTEVASPPSLNPVDTSGSSSSARNRSSLPYPDDDVPSLMPQEDQYVTYLDRTSIEKSKQHRSPSAHPAPTTPTTARLKRPTLASRHSVATDVPKVKEVPTPTSSKDTPYQSTSSSTLSSTPSTSSLPEAALPPCPRSEYSTKHEDWYTLVGHSWGLDVCPDCMHGIIATSPFLRYFQHVTMRRPTRKMICDFSSPWVRIAWLLTLKQNRSDLELVHAVASVFATIQPCPGNHEDYRTWYTFVDQNYDPLPKFYICPHDAKIIENFFPTLVPHMGRVQGTGSVPIKRLCSLRPQSSRFAQIMDILVEIDADAFKTAKAPDFAPLRNFLRPAAKSKLPCSRDNLVIDREWFFIPSLPEFTVCEECFDEVVWPEVKSGNSHVANAFNRRLEFVPRDVEDGYGTSCQLYSPRMRQMWKRAARENDISYLKRKARERREIELALHKKHRDLKKDAQKLNRGSGEFVSSYSGRPAGFGRDEEERERERLKRQLEQIKEVWKEFE